MHIVKNDVIIKLLYYKLLIIYTMPYNTYFVRHFLALNLVRYNLVYLVSLQTRFMCVGT